MSIRPLALLPLALIAACGPERGAGVYPETPEARQARQEAEFRAGERLGLDGLRKALLALGIEESEIEQVADPDHGIEMLRLDIDMARLEELDAQALARLELDSNYRLLFADESVARAVPTAEEIYRRDRAKEIAVLKRHGDWERVPRLKPGEAIPSLARRVENWCDYDAGKGLQVIDGRWLEYSHYPVDSAVGESTPGAATDRFDCLRRTVYATQLRRYFIGYRGEPPPVLYPD